MTLHDVAHQLHSLSLAGFINSERFSEQRLYTQLKAMLRDVGDQYIFEIALPDGKWMAKAERTRYGYDYWIPDTREQEKVLWEELGF